MPRIPYRVKWTMRFLCVCLLAQQAQVLFVHAKLPVAKDSNFNSNLVNFDSSSTEKNSEPTWQASSNTEEWIENVGKDCQSSEVCAESGTCRGSSGPQVGAADRTVRSESESRSEPIRREEITELPGQSNAGKVQQPNEAAERQASQSESAVAADSSAAAAVDGQEISSQSKSVAEASQANGCQSEPSAPAEVSQGTASQSKSEAQAAKAGQGIEGQLESSAAPEAGQVAGGQTESSSGPHVTAESHHAQQVDAERGTAPSVVPMEREHSTVQTPESDVVSLPSAEPSAASAAGAVGTTESEGGAARAADCSLSDVPHGTECPVPTEIPDSTAHTEGTTQTSAPSRTEASEVSSAHRSAESLGDVARGEPPLGTDSTASLEVQPSTVPTEVLASISPTESTGPNEVLPETGGSTPISAQHSVEAVTAETPLGRYSTVSLGEQPRFEASETSAPSGAESTPVASDSTASLGVQPISDPSESTAPSDADSTPAPTGITAPSESPPAASLGGDSSAFDNSRYIAVGAKEYVEQLLNKREPIQETGPDSVPETPTESADGGAPTWPPPVPGMDQPPMEIEPLPLLGPGGRRLRVCVISIPHTTHIHSTYYVARELVARNKFEVYFATTDNARWTVKSTGAKFISAGPLPWPAETEAAMTEQMLDPSTPLTTLFPLFRAYYAALERSMFLALNATFAADPSLRPDFIIANLMTHAGGDLAETLHVPLALVGSTSLAFALDVLGYSAANADWNLPYDSLGRQRTTRTLTRYDRAVEFLLKKMLMGGLAGVFLRAERNSFRASIGLPPLRAISAVRARTVPVFLASVFGFELERSLPKHVHLIGHLLSATSLSPVPETGDAQDEPLATWLNLSEKPVLYVSLGTKLFLRGPFLRRLALALAGLSEFRVLWAFRGDLADLPTGDDAVPFPADDDFRIRPWVLQTEVLKHQNVRVFLSHCGYASIVESLVFGKPILAMPVSADQPMNARLVEDAGAGVILANVTTGDIVQGIRAIETLKAAEAAARVGRSMADAGGPGRVVDLVEEYLLNSTAFVAAEEGPFPLPEAPTVAAAGSILGLLLLLRKLPRRFSRKEKQS